MRLLDIIFSSIAILAILPLFLIVILILKLTGEHEIFYFQKRVGIYQKKFYVIKFATMLKNSENMGAGSITVQGDKRVLPFGKFLRKTKINELPQLFNILKGDMSFVGPRPLLEKQYSFYNIEDQEVISSVRPGLTGIGSLGFRDEEKFFKNQENPDLFYKDKISPVKAKLENWYVKNRSIFLYIVIIFYTFLAVIIPSVNFLKLINTELEQIYNELLE